MGLGGAGTGAGSLEEELEEGPKADEEREGAREAECQSPEYFFPSAPAATLPRLLAAIGAHAAQGAELQREYDAVREVRGRRRAWLGGVPPPGGGGYGLSAPFRASGLGRGVVFAGAVLVDEEGEDGEEEEQEEEEQSTAETPPEQAWSRARWTGPSLGVLAEAEEEDVFEYTRARAAWPGGRVKMRAAQLRKRLLQVEVEVEVEMEFTLGLESGDAL